MNNSALEILDNNDEVIKQDGRRNNRGRPLGFKANGYDGRIRYRPKKWLPEYNQLVVDYIVIPGCTHEMLGKKYGYHKVQICNILSSPQAKDIQEGMANGIIKYNNENVAVKMAEVSSKIIQRVHDFIHDDRLYNADPFSFLDKSLSIGKAIGSLSKTESENNRGTTNNTQINIAIGAEAAVELSKSIKLASSLRSDLEVLPVLESSSK